jgi:hypothetical protein
LNERVIRSFKAGAFRKSSALAGIAGMFNPITTTITQADLLNGIEILLAGKRRPGLLSCRGAHFER